MEKGENKMKTTPQIIKEITENEMVNTLTGGASESTSVGSTLIGDDSLSYLLKVHKRMYIGGSTDGR